MRSSSKVARRVATREEALTLGMNGMLREGLIPPPMDGGSPIQSEIVFGIAKEAVFGTFVAPTRFIAGIPTITSTRNIVRPDQARGYRGQVIDQTVAMTSDISVTAELVPDGALCQSCAGAFGSGSDNYSSAGGAATHAFTPQPQLPSFSYEQDIDIVPGEQVLARQIVGCYVDQFQIKATNQQLITSTVNFVGLKEVTPTTPGNPSNSSPAYFTNASPFSYTMLATTFNGTSSTQMLDATLALMNHTQRVFAANGQFFPSRLVPTKREVTLTTLLDFLDVNFYTQWYNSTKSSTGGWVFTLTHTTNIPSTAVPYSISFTIPGVRPSGEYGMPVASDVVQQNITWSVTVQGTNELSSSWVNDTAGQLA